MSRSTKASLSIALILCLSTVMVKVKNSKDSTSGEMEGLFHPDHAIRYLNSMEVMQASERGKVVAKELEEKRIAFTSQISERQKTFQERAQQYKDRQLTMSKAAREKEEEGLMTEQGTLETLSKDLERKFQNAMNNATEGLFEELKSTAETMAKQEGYDAVIDSLTGRVLYTAKKVEISDNVISAWNVQYNTENKNIKA